jgi:DNA-binding response OmpR family regulator
LLKPLKPQVVIDRTQAILASKQEERRKRELESQIDALQMELHSIQNPKGHDVDSSHQQVLAKDDRFLKRGQLTIDLLNRRATMNGRALGLPTATFDYLVALVRHSPNVVDFQTLVAEAQGYKTEKWEAQELIRWHVYQIRQALELDPRNPTYLLNVRGIGYRLIVN